jgi:guanylate kinase
MERKGSLTVISGFSGAGKGTIMRELLRRHPEYALSVSVTTRKPRPGEADGVDYHFLSQLEFDALVEQDGLLEHAGYVDHCYGTPRRYVEEAIAEGKDVLLEIEVQGAMQIKEKKPEAILLFVTPPSAEELRRRLTGRGTETEDVIRERMERAREEAKSMPLYEYLIVNDNLEDAVELVHRTIQEAKNATFRQKDLMHDLTLQLEA